MVVRGRFEHACRAKESSFAKCRCLQLQSQRQRAAVGVGESSGQRDAADARDVRIDGVAVAEVHRQWVGDRSDGEGGSRGGRSQEHVALLEDVLEFLADQATDLQRTLVVRVVVAGAEHVGAKHDSAPNLGTESFAAAFGVEVEEFLAGAWRDTPAISNSVEAGEVAGGFGGTDHVVGGDADISQGKLHVDDLGSESAVGFHGGIDHVVDGIVVAGVDVLAGQSDAQPLDGDMQVLEVVLRRRVDGRGIMDVFTGNGLQDQRGIFDGPGEGADRLLERSHRALQIDPDRHAIEVVLIVPGEDLNPILTGVEVHLEGEVL